MRLHELYIREFQEFDGGSMTSSSDELIMAVQDLLSMFMADDVQSISTEKFSNMLAAQGYTVSDEELIAAVDASGFAASISQDEITPKGELPPEIMGGDQEELPDTADMASDAAMDNIEDDLT